MEYTKEALEALTAAYGSPLYVFVEKGFVETYNALDRAMCSEYSEYRIAYSFNTLYDAV